MRAAVRLVIFLAAPAALAGAPALRVQTGHSRGIEDLAWDGQGRWLATASSDGSVRRWDPDTGAELQAFPGERALERTDVSADGSRVAACGYGGLQLFEPARGSAARWTVEEASLCTSASLQRSGKLAAAVFDDTGRQSGVVRLLDAATGKLVRKLSIAGAMRVAFSPDGLTVAVGAAHDPERTLALFDTATGKLRRSLPLEDKPYTLAFSPDGTRVAAGSRVFALPEGEQLLQHATVYSHGWSSDGALFLYEGEAKTEEELKSSGPLLLADGHTLAPLRALPAGFRGVRAIAFRPGTHAVALIRSNQASAELWDADTGEQLQTLRGHANKVGAVHFGDGPSLAMHTGDEFLHDSSGAAQVALKLWLPRPGPRLQVVAGGEKGAYGLSADGKLLCNGGPKALSVWSTESGAKLAELPGDFSNTCALSDDGALLAWAPYTPDDGNTYLLRLSRLPGGEESGSLRLEPRESLSHTAFSGDGSLLVSQVDPFEQPATVRVFSVPGLAEVKRFEGGGEAVFRPGGGALVLQRTLGEGRNAVGRLELLETGSWKLLAKAERFWLRDVSPDGKLIAAVESPAKGEPRFHLLDAATLRSVAVLPVLPAADARFSRDGALLAIADEHQVQLWSVKARARLLDLFPLDFTDWVAVAPDGRFEGSPDGFARLSWVQDGRVVPLEAFFAQFHTPGLLASVLTTAALPAREQGQPAPDLARALRPAPLVRILAPAPGQRFEAPEVEVEVEAVDQGGGVQDLRLFQNDKLVGGEARGLRAKAAAPGRLVEKFALALAPGPNRLRAVAASAERTDSAPALVELVLSGPQASADLWLLVVGIDKYDNDRYRLTYAVKDAEAFREAVRAHAAGIFREVHETVLLDEKATRAGLSAAFAAIKDAAKPGDALVFYYAGHGVMSEGGPGKPAQFHLVPPDVTRLYGDDALLEAKAVSADLLRSWTSAIRAQKQLLVLDACQSGGAVEQFAMRGAAEEKAILQLARSAGVVVLAATGTEQLATEFKELGHGVFTYALLEGLAGKADVGNPPDGKITVRELDAWLNDRVPELTQKYRGTRQYPSGFARGQDFPVGTAGP